MKKILSLLALTLSLSAFGQGVKYVGTFHGDAKGQTNVLGIGDGILSVNLGKTPKISQRLQQNLPLRLLFLRDDAIQTEIYLEANLKRWMPQNGTVFGAYTSDYYFGVNGSATFTAANGGNTFWIGNYAALANGGAWTNINGSGVEWPTDSIGLYYWANEGCGTLSVYTQQVGGAWGLLSTVNADNDGTLTPRKTNWTFARITNCIAQVRSTGTNVIAGLGQYATNAGAGFSFSLFGGGDISVNAFVATAQMSNATRAFLLDNTIDGVVFTDQADSNSIYNGIKLWESMVRDNSIDTDLIYNTPTPVDGVNSNVARLQRIGALNGAMAYGRPCIDHQALFLPISKAERLGLLTAGDVHLPTMGNSIAGALSARSLGLTDEFLGALGYRERDASSLTNYGNVKVYKATLTQTGTSAPTATADPRNNMPGTMTWSYVSPGYYQVTSSAGAFTGNKTFIMIGNARSITATDLGHYSSYRDSGTVISVKAVYSNPSGDSANLANDILANTPILIEVWP